MIYIIFEVHHIPEGGTLALPYRSASYEGCRHLAEKNINFDEILDLTELRCFFSNLETITPWPWAGRAARSV